MKDKKNGKKNVFSKILNIFNDKKIKKINDIIQNKEILVVLIWIIGIISLILNNSFYYTPFLNLSFIKCCIVVLYCFYHFLIHLFFIDFIDFCFYLNIEKKINLIFNYFRFFIYFFAILFIYYCFTKCLLFSFIFCFVFYIVVPTFYYYKYKTKENVFDNTFFKSFILTIILTIVIVVFFIPINFGGFKPIKVSFYDYNKKIEEDYYFHGIENGMYKLQKDNRVYLFSIDSGYIEYKGF